MGASIGRNVKIHKDAKLGQADLLTIGMSAYLYLSVYLFDYLFMCHSVNLSVSRTHWPTTCLCICQSIRSYVNWFLSLCLFRCLSVYLSVCLPINSCNKCNNESVVRQCVPYAQSICWYESLILLDCLSVSQSSCLSVFRSACLSVFLSLAPSFLLFICTLTALISAYMSIFPIIYKSVRVCVYPSLSFRLSIVHLQVLFFLPLSPLALLFNRVIKVLQHHLYLLNFLYYNTII